MPFGQAPIHVRRTMSQKQQRMAAAKRGGETGLCPDPLPGPRLISSGWGDPELSVSGWMPNAGELNEWVRAQRQAERELRSLLSATWYRCILEEAVPRHPAAGTGVAREAQLERLRQAITDARRQQVDPSLLRAAEARLEWMEGRFRRRGVLARSSERTPPDQGESPLRSARAFAAADRCQGGGGPPFGISVEGREAALSARVAGQGGGPWRLPSNRSVLSDPERSARGRRRERVEFVPNFGYVSCA